MFNVETYENDLQDLNFVFLELKKFKKPLEKLKNLEEKWMYCFKHAETGLSVEEISQLLLKDL